MEPHLTGRVVVVSPHLDDAVLSLGAAMARPARLGADWTIE
jgi:LmbE family N-acetylglucosaminyl deacetylase